MPLLGDDGGLLREAYVSSSSLYRWQEWSKKIGNEFRAQEFFFGLIDKTTLATVRTYHSDPLSLDLPVSSYIERLHNPENASVAVDPRVERLMVAGGRRRPCCGTWTADLGGHQVTVGAVDVVERYRALTVAKRDGPPLGIDLERMKQLLPVVADALRLALLHGIERERALWKDVTSRGSRLLVPVDRQGHVFGPPAVAEQLARLFPEFRIRNGVLGAIEPSADRRLREIISTATRSADPVASARPFQSADGKHQFIVVAYPIPRAHRYVVPHGAAARLTIADPDRLSAKPSASLLSEAFGLTRRESQVAELLANGETVSTLATRLKISSQTAAVHVRNLLNKTGAHRQLDLIRILTMI